MNAACADPVAGRVGVLSADGKICAVVGDNRCQIFRTDTFAKQSETGVQPGMRFIALSPDGALFASGAWKHGGVTVWDCRTGELVKKLATDDGHLETSATVAFSPSGRHLVVSTLNEYTFYERGSWTVMRTIPQPPANDFPAMMAFSRDGRIFAGTCMRNLVRLYDAATGNVLADLEAPNAKEISALSFNHDGTQLAVCESAAALRVWDLRVIRQQLAELKLDWDEPPRAPAPSGASSR